MLMNSIPKQIKELLFVLRNISVQINANPRIKNKTNRPVPVSANIRVADCKHIMKASWTDILIFDNLCRGY